jgi:hypothetical protein
MKLYLDDDSAKAALALLRKAGHSVVVPIDAALSGADDSERLLYAVQQSLVLMTRNRDDFRLLHRLVLAQADAIPDCSSCGAATTRRAI